MQDPLNGSLSRPSTIRPERFMPAPMGPLFQLIPTLANPVAAHPSNMIGRWTSPRSEGAARDRDRFHVKWRVRLVLCVPGNVRELHDDFERSAEPEDRVALIE